MKATNVVIASVVLVQGLASAGFANDARDPGPAAEPRAGGVAYASGGGAPSPVVPTSSGRGGHGGGNWSGGSHGGGSRSGGSHGGGGSWHGGSGGSGSGGNWHGGSGGSGGNWHGGSGGNWHGGSGGNWHGGSGGNWHGGSSGSWGGYGGYGGYGGRYYGGGYGGYYGHGYYPYYGGWYGGIGWGGWGGWGGWYGSYGYPYWSGAYGYYGPYGGYGWGYGYPRYYGYSGAAWGGGALDFDVSPERAEVWIDGKRIGVADDYDGFPDYLWLEKGTYDIAIYLPGFQTIARQYSVYPGVVIDVEDHMEEGETVHPNDLVSSSHVNRDERLRRDQEAQADANRMYGDGQQQGQQQWSPRSNGESLDARGEPATVRLEVTPDDASVYLDGRFLGTGGDLGRLRSGLIVDPGMHTLEVVRPGYAAARQQLDIQAGSNQNVEVELESGD